MKRILLIALLVTALSQLAAAQDIKMGESENRQTEIFPDANKMTRANGILSSRFIMNNVLMSYSEAKNYLATNPAAYSLFKSAKSMETLASITAFTSGFLLGFFGVELLSTGFTEGWGGFIAGGLLIIPALTLEMASFKRYDKALGIYNDGLLSQYAPPESTVSVAFVGLNAGPDMRYGAKSGMTSIAGLGIGLQIKF